MCLYGLLDCQNCHQMSLVIVLHITLLSALEPLSWACLCTSQCAVSPMGRTRELWKRQKLCQNPYSGFWCSVRPFGGPTSFVTGNESTNRNGWPRVCGLIVWQNPAALVFCGSAHSLVYWPIFCVLNPAPWCESLTMQKMFSKFNITEIVFKFHDLKFLQDNL